MTLIINKSEYKRIIKALDASVTELDPINDREKTQPLYDLMMKLGGQELKQSKRK